VLGGYLGPYRHLSGAQLGGSLQLVRLDLHDVRVKISPKSVRRYH
jgi:hypothetical protein